MRTISVDARMLGCRLGLGDLVRPQPCMSYQNACVCPECLERAETAAQPRPTPAPQPWELVA